MRYRFRRWIRLISRIILCVLVPVAMVGLILFYIVSLGNTSYSSVSLKEPDLKETVDKALEQVSDRIFAAGLLISGDDAEELPGFQITILDVGQASASLIESNGEYMVFDGGDKETSSKVVALCKTKGITHIKYLVASHYHSDHVYGLIGLIKAGITFDYLVVPDYETESYAKTALLRLVDASKILHPYPEQRLCIGDVWARCIGPVTDEYSDDNGYSVGYIFEYDTLKVLIDGDATQESEQDMLSEGINVDADILVVPHHGSEYSSSSAWLEAVSPDSAIISCGTSNEYGHPHEKVLDGLKECGVRNLYRTDLQGSIVIDMTDGNYVITPERVVDEKLLWMPGEGKEESKEYLSLWDAKIGTLESYYVGNKYTNRFHRPSCNKLPEETRRVIISDRDTALGGGYIPCTACSP